MAQSKELVAKADGTVAQIDSAQTLKASKALLSHISKAAQEVETTASKRNLLADGDDEELTSETPIWLNVTTKRHISDDARLKPGKIRLPHSLNDNEQSTICLITADPQRVYKNIVADDEFPVELGKRITRIIDVTKLKAKYSRYEAQRKLFSEHDIFLGDDRIVNRLPKILGKTFFKTTQKRPVPVVLSAKKPKGGKTKVKGPRPKKNKEEGETNAGKPDEIAKEIEKALSCALVALSPTTNTSIRVAYAGMTPEQVAANAEAVSTALVEKWVPQKWKNVKSIHIKGPKTAALPIWLTDELWLDEGDVVANNDPRSRQAAAEKANVGKKRKSVGDATEEEESKPSKKAKAKALLPEGNDDKLDSQIADRKARLRKQKASAAKAVDA
ncbi:ribosomal protein l1p/L10e family protein [Sarocladium implicatum]|nr:ribosomal protein l1p/L10e family protein [Sarocladium implicatum]